MAAALSHPSTLSTFSQLKSNFELPFPRTHFSSLQTTPILKKSKSLLSFHNFSHLGHPRISVARAKSDDFLEAIDKEESLPSSDGKPVKFLFWVLLWASVSIGLYAFSGDAKAAAIVAASDSIRASGFGVKVADALLQLKICRSMVPVPFIILYVKRFATFLTGKNETASRFLDMLFERAKEKAGPVEEFSGLD